MSEDTRVILDLGRTCRTCLVQKTTEELRSLLENNLGKMLSEIANIQLDFNSSLPTCICTECLKTLNVTLEFRTQIQEAETQLRSLIYSVADQSDDHMTVIYKSFAVLESTGFSEGGERSIHESNKDKNEQCGKVMVIENTDNVPGSSQDTTTNNGKKCFGHVFKDDTDIYAVSQEIGDNGDPIDYFASDDDSINTSKNKESETVNINKSTIFINGNISNVIKWADSENNSVSLSNNFIENNQNETLKQKEVLTSVQALKLVAENTEHFKNKDLDKVTDNANGNIKTATNQNFEKVTSTAKFSCNLCAKKFRYVFGFKAHLLKHGIPMVCEICLTNFDDATTYLSHTKSNHPDFKPFACPNCDKNFAVMSTLKKHFFYHATDQRPRKFVCDVCGKKFSQHNFLLAHKRSHSGNNPYQCDICNKNFSGAHSLRNHLKIHGGEKKHKCDTCEARFIHRFSLRAHQRTHSGEKPFGCKLCNNNFSTSSYLKIHMRTHTSEKPYRCLWCQKNFVSRCALAAHEKSHTGEKKFQCDVCGWRSTRLADLQTHIRTHTGEKPYFCDQCDKRYKTASNLAAHKKTHLGLREHICHICNKAFGDPRTLKGHIRVHTGETPYQCHMCGNRFKQSGQLSAHRKTHRN